MSSKPLNFPTFFKTVLKDRISQTQKDAFQILTASVEFNVESMGPEYAPSLISRYCNDKQLPNALCKNIQSASDDELEKRIEALGIQDPIECVEQAKQLVQQSALSEAAKNLLLSKYNDNKPYLFIACVLRETAKYKKRENTVKEVIQTRFSDDSFEKPKPAVEEGRDRQPDPTGNSAYILDDGSHSDISGYEEFVRDLGLMFSFEAIRSYKTSYIKHYLLEFPNDIPCLLQAAYDMCVEVGIINLDMADFYAATNIDPETFMPRDGRLDLYEIVFEKKESAIKLLEKLKLREADSMVLQIYSGMDWGLTEASDIVNTVQELCNEDLNILFGYKYLDNQTEGAKIMLLVHTQESVGETQYEKNGEKEQIPPITSHPKVHNRTVIDDDGSRKELKIPSFMNVDGNQSNNSREHEGSKETSEDEDDGRTFESYFGMGSANPFGSVQMAQKGDKNQQFGYASNITIHND